MNIENKVIFEKLNVLKKRDILKIIKKYSPDHIFYLSGQSSLTKSVNLKKKEGFNVQTYIAKKVTTKLNQNFIKQTLVIYLIKKME